VGTPLYDTSRKAIGRFGRGIGGELGGEGFVDHRLKMLMVELQNSLGSLCFIVSPS
jgi:hypothetical protein